MIENVSQMDMKNVIQLKVLQALLQERIQNTLRSSAFGFHKMSKMQDRNGTKLSQFNSLGSRFQKQQPFRSAAGDIGF